MGNVPLLQKLAEKLGKTTKEIRDMVKGKEISYEDVAGVLKELTDEGGMFYNMQEVVSQSVKAKFKNVKDAMDIMYGEMAEGSPGDALKGVAEALMELTKNWKDVATIMTTVTALWAVNRAATMVYTQTLGAANAQTMASIAAHRRKEAAMLKEVSLYRSLTAAEQTQMMASKSLTLVERTRIAMGKSLTMEQKKRLIASRQQKIMDMALAVSEKKLSTEHIARQVAMGKLSKAQARAILGLADLSVAERTAAINAVNGTRQISRFSMAIQTMGNAALGVFSKLSKFLFNPQMLFMGAITAGVEIWQRYTRQLEEAEEISRSIYEKSQEAIRNTQTLIADSGIKYYKNEKTDKGEVRTPINQSDISFENLDKVEFEIPPYDSTKAKQSIEDWKEYLRNYAVNANELINKAILSDEGKLLSEEEQYKNLAKAIAEVAAAQYGLQDVGGIFENSLKASGGLMDDDLIENIKDLGKTTRNFGANVSAAYSKYRKAVDDGIKAAEKQDKAFAEKTKGMATYAQKFKELIEQQEKYPTAVKAFKADDFGGQRDMAWGQAGGNTGSFMTDIGDVRDASQEVENDWNAFLIQFDAELETQGKNIKNLSVTQKQALMLGFKQALEGIRDMSQEEMDDLTKRFAKHIEFEIGANDDEFQAKRDQIYQDLDNLVEGDWTIPINFIENINDTIDEANKKYKLAKEFFEKTQKIRLKFGIEMKMGQLLTGNAKKSVLDKITDPAVRDEVDKIIEGLNQASTAFNKATEASSKLGFDLDDGSSKKSGKKGDKKSGKKTGKKEPAFKDEFAKRWDERIRIMQDAYNLYDKWEKKVGHDEAIKEVTLQYQKVFDEWSKDKTVPFTLKVENIENFREQVETYLEAARKRYAEQTSSEANKKKYNNGEEALRVIRTAEKLLSDMKYDNFTKAAEDFKSVIEEVISDLNERWDIFNTVREATSDSFLAARIADFGGVDLGERTAAGAMKNELVKQIREAGGVELADLITYDTHLDEQGIRKMLEDIIPNAEDTEKYKKSIESIIKIYQEWQRLQKQVIKDDISAFAKLIGSAVSYDAKIQKLNDDLLKQESAIAAGLANGSITEEDADKAIAIAESQYDWEKMKLSAEYANVYNNAVAMSRDEFEHATEAIEELIKKLRKLGLISPEDYVAEKEKLDKARKEFNEAGIFGDHSAATSFIVGGNEGLLNYYAKRRDRARQMEKNAMPGSSEEQTWKQEAEHYAELFNNLSRLTETVKKAVTALQNLQSVVDVVKGTLDSLGISESATNTTSDISSVIGGGVGGATALSALGPYGMMAGAALGLIGGIAQTHDASLERQIAKLRDDVEKIEANTALIQQARERTLGYDTGDLRRSYTRQYTPEEYEKRLMEAAYAGDAIEVLKYAKLAGQHNTMLDYYSSNSIGNGYQQEYSNLIKERQDYLDILSGQQSKKKQSNAEIEETKKKIAELDDQIRFFTQDLAKELWDIDIKGWADQISDALASAFENGESMAKAYGDSVRSILQTLMHKMMQLKILEPMFASLQDKLFGSNGVFNPEDMNASMSAVTKVIGEFFGKGGEGERSITAATEFMTAFQHGLQSVGLSVLNDSSSTLSSDVSGIKEETADLLAAYVNALRQDVAVNRLLQTQFVTEMWPSYIEQFTQAVSSLNNIDSNVATIRALLSENGALYVMLDSMKSHFDNITNGNERVMVQ